MATCGLSAPPPNATSCGGVGARRWWTKRWASRSPEYWSAISTPPTTIMTAPNSGAGPTCCGTSTTSAPLYPDAAPLARWADAVHGIYDRAKAFTHPQAKRRRTAQLALERQLLALGQPFRHDPSATQAKLCRRIERHIKELFVFVAEPAVPSDNNAAERSLRHLVISRKISGSTRSEQGTESKMTLASLFGTWRAQGLNPLAACRQLLVSPLLCHRARLHCSDLPGVPTALHTSGGTGRRGPGSAAPRRQPAQPDRHAAGRGAAAHPQRPVVSGHRASVAPQRGSHRERHPSHGAAGPTGSGRDPGPHPRQPGGPRRRNRLARGRRQWLRVDFQHPHRTLLPAAGSGQGGGGRSAGRVVLRSIGQRFLRRLPPL